VTPLSSGFCLTISHALNTRQIKLFIYHLSKNWKQEGTLASTRGTEDCPPFRVCAANSIETETLG
jgi:hypothetical protein